MESIEALERLKAARPAIPAEVAREILIEAGHRCAVCGAECPLERAHIIPWRECREHSAANLICLCANCHARADSEGWGQQTLQDYKNNPWVLRHRPLHSGSISSRTKLQLIIDMEIDRFDERYRRFLRHAVAAFLETDPEDVEIVEIKDGSVRLVITVPTDAISNRSLDFTENLRKYLQPLDLLGVENLGTAEDAPKEEVMYPPAPSPGFVEEPEEFDDYALPVESESDWRKE
jgi:type I restriction enzyme R subunit